MDKQTLFAMLQSIRERYMLGPKIGDYEIGARVDFALSKELIKRSEDGNFIITDKGIDLLEGRLKWEDI
ncbi:MAG: hypothetical protein JSU01_12525 [Bacteroidetes bacterium]|nr:hypothetical protein [Bacteroidota bacterium]